MVWFDKGVAMRIVCILASLRSVMRKAPARSLPTVSMFYNGCFKMQRVLLHWRCKQDSLLASNQSKFKLEALDPTPLLHNRQPHLLHADAFRLPI